MLAASLGLSASSRELALSAGKMETYQADVDQIHSLLQDPDVASALRIMSSPNHLPISRTGRLDPQSRSFYTPSTRSISPHAEPYLATAPPPLTSSDGHMRNRTTSTSSTIASPDRSQWRSGESLVERRRRASSRVTIPENEGGHVPFTHHVTIIPDESEDEVEDEQAKPTRPTTGTPDTTAGLANPVVPTQETNTAKLNDKHKRMSLSQIFHFKKKEHPKVAVTEVDHSHHSVDKERDRLRREKDADMRRKEQERRDAELGQGGWICVPTDGRTAVSRSEACGCSPQF
jgi:hypothetical protein